MDGKAIITKTIFYCEFNVGGLIFENVDILEGQIMTSAGFYSQNRPFTSCFAKAIWKRTK